MINIDKANKIQERIENYIKKENKFNGQILVAVDGQKIFSSAYGMANFELGVPNTLATKFKLCSISKQFTAVLVLQLVEKGLISLDDKVKKYIADFSINI